MDRRIGIHGDQADFQTIGVNGGSNGKSMVLILAELKSDSTEGSLQRVQFIDSCIAPAKRVYVKFDNRTWKLYWGLKRALAQGPVQYHLSSWNPLHWLVFFFLWVRSESVYFHSIYSAASVMVRAFLRFIPKDVLWDVHGIVPEELRLLGEVGIVPYYERIEALVAHRARVVICVTRQRLTYLNDKYPRTKTIPSILLPILPILPRYLTSHKNDIVIYSGGSQKWQKPDLVSTIMAHPRCDLKQAIFTPDVDQFKSMIDRENPHASCRVTTLHGGSLFSEYRLAKFGLILRDAHIVNRVSSPTKLSEYLHFGIVPIIAHAEIGDFAELGYRYLPYRKLLTCELPTEAELREIVSANQAVLERLIQIQNEGKKQLTALVARVAR